MGRTTPRFAENRFAEPTNRSGQLLKNTSFFSSSCYATMTSRPHGAAHDDDLPREVVRRFVHARPAAEGGRVILDFC
jgi:hypothetical protein